MCICFFQVNNSSDAKYPLIFCGNRDEFLSRESIPLHRWTSSSSSHTSSLPLIYSGLDVVRGGTWLACSSTAVSYRFAVIHNIRRKHNEIDQSKASRGDIPRNFVTSNISARDYAEKICADGESYYGFTLIVGDSFGVYFTTNHELFYNNKPVKLDSGIYSISNALLDTPWPKVVMGKEAFRLTLSENVENEERLISRLMRNVLKDTTFYITPLPGILEPQLEMLMSSIHINPFQWGEKWGFYGTRMQTVVIIRKDSTVRIAEHSLDTVSSVKNWNAKWTSVEYDSRDDLKLKKRSKL
jgi:uncharacterized protein with NRDE domain